jgi:hypothetical protein
MKVIASICDHGSSSQAAINVLLKQISEECLRAGTEHRYECYGEEVTHLYDVLHIFKGIRNNLLKRDKWDFESCYFFYSSLTNEIAAGAGEEFVLSNEIANVTSKIELLTKKNIPGFVAEEKHLIFST